MTPGSAWELSDGLVTIRPPKPGESDLLLRGRDAEWEKWLGPGDPHPQPTACVVVDGEVVGWVDFDTERQWLQPGEVNIGYSIFAPHRGHGYATRAVKLLLRHLALDGGFHSAMLSVDLGNAPSHRVAEKAGFRVVAEDESSRDYRRPIAGGEATFS